MALGTNTRRIALTGAVVGLIAAILATVAPATTIGTAAARWLVPTIGSALMLGGLIIVLRALFGDRARGRKRCSRCWYEMSSVASLTCPECGRTARREASLYRTRRRWRLAALGMLIMALGSTRFAARWIARGDYFPLIPTPILVSWADALDRLPARAQSELEGRLAVPLPSDERLRLRLRALSPLSSPTRTVLSARALAALERNPRYPARALLFELMPGYLDSPHAQRAQPLLLAALNDPQPIVRLGALATLHRVQGFDPKKVAPALAAFVQRTPRTADDALLYEAVAALEACGAAEPAVVPALASLLQNPATRDRSLGQLHDEVLWTLSRLGPAAGPSWPSVTATCNPTPETDSDALATYTLLLIQNRVPTAAAAAREMLLKSEEACRAFGVAELARQPEAFQEELVMRATTDHSMIVRVCAAAAASAGKATDSRAALLSSIREAAEFGVLEQALEILARHDIDLTAIAEALHEARTDAPGLYPDRIRHAVTMVDFLQSRSPGRGTSGRPQAAR